MLTSRTYRTTLRSELANRKHIGLELLRNRHLYSLMCGEKKKKKFAIIGPALAGPAGVVPAPLHNPSFVIFTNGESCFVVERSIFEMVDRFAGRHEEISEAKPR